jgi:hypothetical protein
MSIRRSRKSALLVSVYATVGLSVSLPAAAADTAETETPAVWTPKQTSFTYMGFTTKYSCEGLVSKVRSVLLTLGARREDLSVSGIGCFEVGRPAPLPGVRVRMNVLQPVTTTGAAKGATPVVANWKPVQVQLNRDPLSEAGECELVEQIKQKLLPLFATRNVDFKSNCVPHQLKPGGTLLSAEVLMPAPTDRQASAAQEH